MLKCRLPIIPFSVQTRPFFPVHFALTYPLRVMFSTMPSSVAHDSNQYFREVHQGNGGADGLQAHMASPGGEVESSKQAARTVAYCHTVPLQGHQQDENDAQAANSTDVEVHEAKHASTSVAVAGHESNPSKRLKIMKKIRDFAYPDSGNYGNTYKSKYAPLKDQWEPDEGWQSVNPGEAADEPDLQLLEATVSNRKPNKNNKKHQKHCK